MPCSSPTVEDNTFLPHDVPLGSVPARQEVVTIDASPHDLGGSMVKEVCQGSLEPSVGRAAHQCPRTLDCLLVA